MKALAMGEDFKTGALAGGANEAMVSYLADRVMPEGYEPGKGGAEQAKANLLAMSNVVGLLSSVVTGGDPQVAADIAATATQYNHLSHSDLARAANELNACAAKDGGCSEDVLQKFVRLSREQEIAAFQSCATNPDSCATTSSMVANAQARAEQLKDLAATAVAPNAQHVFALLLAENNKVQNALAQVTAGAKVDSVVQELQNRLGFSDARKEMIRDAMVAAASMAGRGSAGGAKGTELPSLANKPLGLGSTGRSVPANLNEKLAMEQAISNPLAGRQLPVPMTDSRWPAADGWVKSAQNINGIEIHYVRNSITGAIDDFKFK